MIAQLFQIVCLAFSLHDPLGRLAALEEQIAAQPENLELLLQRGELHREAGHLRAAVSDAEHVLQSTPLNARAWWLGSSALADLGDSRDAIAWLGRYQAIQPEDGAGWRLRAILLQDLGSTLLAAQSAESALDKLSRLTPEDYLLAAELLHATGDSARAMRHLERGLAELGPVVTLLEAGVDCAEEAGDLGAAARWAQALHRSAPAVDAWRERAADLAAAFGQNVEALGPFESKASAALPSSAGASLAMHSSAGMPTEAAGFAASEPAATLVASGSTWKYLDDGSDQGDAWRQAEFDDAHWASGPAQLGYGDDDEATVISFGPDSDKKFTTSYFRHAFSVSDPAQFVYAQALLLRDDGAVVYLNGSEIARDSMPRGEITSSTFASSSAGGAQEDAFVEHRIDPSLLLDGVNVLAVEVHQASLTSSDISFDLQLEARQTLPPVELRRGPYLQSGTTNSAIVCWRTNVESDSSVWLGTGPANLKLHTQSASPTTEHEIKVDGLLPNTRYYYGIGSDEGMLLGGDDAHYFRTAPAIGTAAPTRIWVIGDSGTADSNAKNVQSSYLNMADNVDTDVWLMLGDNAYNSGTDSEYQTAVFDVYHPLLSNTFLWPTLGNHDSRSADAVNQTGAYFDIFSLPTAAEAGGLASGTEAYYSFDFGNVHFVCLDSDDSNRAANGPMLTWLQADLASNTSDWTIAYWHHPPYTKGSHDSDNLKDSAGRMADMRQNALPILEAAGVDLVLTGHSHSYERSMLIDRHYGLSTTLSNEMILDATSGDPAGTGSYHKLSAGSAAHEGAVHSVVGCSGKISGGPLDHPAMRVSINSLGSMVLDIEGPVLFARFLDDSGQVLDQFSITKGEGPFLVRDRASISVKAGGEQQLFVEASLSVAGSPFQVGGSLSASSGFDWDRVPTPLDPGGPSSLFKVDTNRLIFQNNAGNLDESGRATVKLVPPERVPAGFIGMRFYHVVAVFDESELVSVSRPSSLQLTK